MNKCEFCGRETRKSREEFSEIDWIAFQLGNGKMYCACYEHHQELIDFIENKLK